MAQFDESKKYQEQEEVFVGVCRMHNAFKLTLISLTMVVKSSSCTLCTGNQT